MYPQYWTPSMGVFLCPRSFIASQEISATFKQHICDMQFAVVANKSKMRIAIVPEENEKSEPFSNRKQVRIFLVWWARVDYASRAAKNSPLGCFCAVFGDSAAAVRIHPWICFEKFRTKEKLQHLYDAGVFGGAKQPKSEPLPTGASLAAISSKAMVFVPSL